MDDNKSQTEMSHALDLCELFGGNCADVEVGVFNQNGWGWADAVLAAKMSGRDGNPYEYGAYDLIRGTFPAVCTAVECDETGAVAQLWDLLTTYETAMQD